jgi:hypothetical protein
LGSDFAVESKLRSQAPCGSLNLSDKASNHRGFLPGKPVDEFGVGGSAGRFSGSQKVNSLKEVALTLGIISHKHCYMWWEVKLEAHIVTKVRQAQMLNLYSSTSGVAGEHCSTF